MQLKRRTVIAACGASLALAGCIGDDAEDPEPDDDDDDDDPGVPDDDDADDDEPMVEDATVQVGSHPEYGDILVGPDGMTLYMFDADTQGEPMSACYDACADAWPPLEAEDDYTAGEGVTAELSTFERDDGTMQVAANGWPLYYWAADEEPGDATGQGVNDVWWVLRPDGTPIRPDDADPTVDVVEHPEFGEILVGPDGMTLYNFDADTQGDPASACHDDCADAWPPLTAEDDPVPGPGVTAELSTFERDDGPTQVAANGWPLYFFAGDEEPGDTNGHGVNDVWWVMTPAGDPIRPGEEPTDDDDDDGGASPGPY